MTTDDPGMARRLARYIATGNATFSLATTAAVWFLNDGDGSLLNVEHEQALTVLLKTGWAALWGGYYLGAMRSVGAAIDRPRLPVIPTSETNAYERLVPRVTVNVLGNACFGLAQAASYVFVGSPAPIESVLADSICFISTQALLELDANSLSIEKIVQETRVQEDAKNFVRLQAYSAATFLSAVGRAIGC